MNEEELIQILKDNIRIYAWNDEYTVKAEIWFKDKKIAHAENYLTRL